MVFDIVFRALTPASVVYHNLLLIYRNFLRAKAYFLINLAGLTIGLACALLIYLWVRDEMLMNKFHMNDARLYQVMENQKYADEISTVTSTPGILAETLKEEFPEVEYSAATTWINPYTLSVKDNNVKAKGYYVGKDYFRIFSYKLLQGQPSQVLQDKFAIVISRRLAIKLYGAEENAVGKTVELDHNKSFAVTGIFEDPPATSSYEFDFVMSFEEFKDNNKWTLEWGTSRTGSFLVLREGTNFTAFSEKIKGFVKRKSKESNVTLFLQKFSDRYLYGRYENGQQAGGRIEYIRLFSIIAVFTLLIACINFMNLATARASRNAKEVGIKKSMGAGRQSLILQFITESMVTAVLALLIAVALVSLFLPQFNIITDKKIALSFTDIQLLISFLGIALFTGIVSGSYPALYLSGFEPAAVMKGLLKSSVGELWVRKGLVVFQFFLSVVLIASVMVIYKQVSFVETKNLGYKKDHLIQFHMEGAVSTNTETFLNEVSRIPGVISAAAIGHDLLGRQNNTSELRWEGKNPNDLILFENVSASYGLFETLGVELEEGRLFSEEFPADTTKIIFNETGIRVMNLKNPIGKTVNLGDTHKLEIIGVVKDFHFESLHEVISPLFFLLSPRNTWNIMVRLEAGKEKETLDALSRFYTRFNPGFTLEYQFQDREYAQRYASEQRMATLSAYFAGTAIMISCLGLFGLAAFTAERRQKEIGIRKLLGSSSTGIILLVSGDFTRLVMLSILLGWPVSYWLLDNWLERFAFHTDLSAWYFVAAGLIALLIALLTVVSQAIRASRVNPINCLRSE